MGKEFFNFTEGPWEEIGGGQKRRIFHMNNLTAMLMRMPKGTVTDPSHKHPQEQVAVILNGRAKMYVGTAVKELGPGEGYRITSNVPHHIEILEDAVLIDIFSPKRDDLKATEP